MLRLYVQTLLLIHDERIYIKHFKLNCTQSSKHLQNILNISTIMQYSQKYLP